jgi:SOS response regulatory protein OraA/RecX
MNVLACKPQAEEGLFRVSLEDGSVFTFRAEYLAGGFPEAKLPGEIGDDGPLRFAGECYRCERAALRLVARAEQNSAGLSRKLLQRGFSQAASGKALERLCSLGLVSDERYAERWVTVRLLRGRETPAALLSKLRAKGIDGGAARAALKKCLNPDNELPLARHFLKKHGRSLRLSAVLKSQGFSAEFIEQVVENPQLLDARL